MKNYKTLLLVIPALLVGVSGCKHRVTDAERAQWAAQAEAENQRQAELAKAREANRIANMDPNPITEAAYYKVIEVVTQGERKALSFEFFKDDVVLVNPAESFKFDIVKSGGIKKYSNGEWTEDLSGNNLMHVSKKTYTATRDASGKSRVVIAWLRDNQTKYSPVIWTDVVVTFSSDNSKMTMKSTPFRSQGGVDKSDGGYQIVYLEKDRPPVEDDN